MTGFAIADLPLAGGLVGMCPVPLDDTALRMVQAWRPDLVISLTELAELRDLGAMAVAGCVGRDRWRHFPVRDFGVPDGAQGAVWQRLSDEIVATLNAGGRVLIHCRGGCGRTGMIVLRLMIFQGQEPQAALAGLRHLRPCAVETAAQMQWALLGGASG